MLAMMIAKDPAVARAIRATVFTPMPLTGPAYCRLLPKAEGDKPRPAGTEAAGIEPAQDVTLGLAVVGNVMNYGGSAHSSKPVTGRP